MFLSPVLQKHADKWEMVKHSINLFLELFGECEIVSVNLARLDPPVTRSANWRMLPPGEYPWERLREHLEKGLGKASSGTELVIKDRAETMRRFGPSQIVVGQGGFADYVAYIFAAIGLVALESIRKDNAIYVLGTDWKVVSRLTKAEILLGKHHVARIIHSKGWKDRAATLLKRAAAA